MAQMVANVKPPSSNFNTEKENPQNKNKNKK
jgi:hypothetical protein